MSEPARVVPFEGAVGPFAVNIFITERQASSMVENIYDHGGDCEGCEFHRVINDVERLPGRAAVAIQERYCKLVIDDEDRSECPALDKAVHRLVLDCLEDRAGVGEVAVVDAITGGIAK